MAESGDEPLGFSPRTAADQLFVVLCESLNAPLPQFPRQYKGLALVLL